MSFVLQLALQGLLGAMALATGRASVGACCAVKAGGHQRIAWLGLDQGEACGFHGWVLRGQQTKRPGRWKAPGRMA